jgi:uncharacterized membrane protein YdfJ with MMPL/SSD domain
VHIDAIFGAIGRFAVRFRWLVLLVWIAGAIGAATQLPALSSVTQNNNSKPCPPARPASMRFELSVRHRQLHSHSGRGGQFRVGPPPRTTRP